MGTLAILQAAHARLVQRGDMTSAGSMLRHSIWVHVADLGHPELPLPLHPPGGVTLSTVARGRSNTSHLLPDYTFATWPAIGHLEAPGGSSSKDIEARKHTPLDTLAGFVAELTASGRRPASFPQAFFAGDLSFHPTRLWLSELAELWPDQLEVRHVTSPQDPEHVHFSEFARWSYLIDMPGGGWSGRLKFLPFLRRPLIVVDRPAWGWADGQLEPFKHYRPVRMRVSGALSGKYNVSFDPDDVLRQVQWCMKHPRKAAAMVRRAYSRVARMFTAAAVAEHAANVIAESLPHRTTGDE